MAISLPGPDQRAAPLGVPAAAPLPLGLEGPPLLRWRTVHADAPTAGVRSGARRASRMLRRTTEWTRDWSRKRTSVLAGWTLTSTAAGSISSMRTMVG